MTVDLLYFDDQRDAALRFAAAAGTGARAITLHRFPDGESLVTLPTPLAPRVLVFCTLGQPNTRLVELMLAARTARTVGVRHLTLVAPYLCYMRQDRAFRAGEAVSQTIVGGWLAQLFDAVVTVDPHLHRIERLEQAVPSTGAVTLTAARLLAEFVAATVPHAVLVGPDAESAQWVDAVAEAAGRPRAVFAKQRHGDREVDVVAGDAPVLGGRPVVLIDDIASSGRTLAAAAHVCLAAGARSVDALVTHALCGDADLGAMRGAGIGRLWSTDSVEHASNAIPLAGLLAQGCRARGLL
jgi:ribose-phosphate pyrophosphokinase